MGNEEEEGVFHDQIEIEDFEYDADNETFTYPCPCGDLFTITKVPILQPICLSFF
jgi:diphthamide biosynthesis protein 3